MLKHFLSQLHSYLTTCKRVLQRFQYPPYAFSSVDTYTSATEKQWPKTDLFSEKKQLFLLTDCRYGKTEHSRRTIKLSNNTMNCVCKFIQVIRKDVLNYLSWEWKKDAMFILWWKLSGTGTNWTHFTAFCCKMIPI